MIYDTNSEEYLKYLKEKTDKRIGVDESGVNLSTLILYYEDTITMSNYSTIDKNFDRIINDRVLLREGFKIYIRNKKIDILCQS